MKPFYIFSSCAIIIAAGCLPTTAVSQDSANLPDEYLKNLKNYKFCNTRGMRDLNPERIPWIPEHRQDPDNWNFPTDEEIQTLRDMGINFPDFNFIEGGELEPGQKRQKTHTVEHIIYAMPGDAVSLYPYYGLEEYKEPVGDEFLSTMDYLETFSHWYDYKTGGRLKFTSKDNRTFDLLDFPHDRNYIQITDNNGFYGGIYMSPGTNNINSGKKYVVSTPDEYIAAVNDINANGGKGFLELTADLDFTGKNSSDIPILGTASNPFSGTINGTGHTISNIQIDRPGENGVGLVGFAAGGAAIYNLSLSNCAIAGRTQVGLVGYLTGGNLTVRNIRIEDNCSIIGVNPDGGDHFVGALLGRCENEGSDNRLSFENIYIGGKIGNSAMSDHKNTAVCGWLATNSSHGNSIFKNIVVNADVFDTEDLAKAKYIRRFTHGEYQPVYITDAVDNSIEERHSNYSIVYTNCYGNLDDEDPGWHAFSDLPDMEGWFDVIEVSPYNLGGELLNTSNHRPWDKAGTDPENQNRRKAGTSAVFYFPECLKDEWNEDTEYVIAADFSQTFYPDTHINVSEMKITEPLIAFRHIFRIRDARMQTEQLQNNNNDYTRKHQHKVTARVNSPFQIRLDSPLPTGWGTSGGVTNYYFLNSEGNYDRIRQFGIRVLDGSTHEVIPGTQGFEFGADIRMRRAHSADSKDFSIPEGQFRYHTMLKHQGVNGEKHFIVQIIAKDNNGNPIITPDGEMVLMQFDINFVNSRSASLVTEAELYDTDPNNRNNNRYRHARDEYLKEKYGDTQFKIDFDNYFKLNTLTDTDLRNKMISYSVSKFDIADQWYRDEDKLNLNVWDHNSDNHLTSPSRMHHSFYKWPVAWDISTYAFGYNYRYNYNMYMLATHSTNVPYHAAADHTTLNIDNEEGLYDRLYYKTKRLRESNPELKIKQQQGYFYYVNAASDPGVSARLNIDMPCPGNRVIVSAWVAEMTKAAANDGYEAANLSFNFVAVMKDNKERVVLHNFITGYIPDDKLGKWCNVYYSFIPRMSEFYNDTKTFDDVDHFELELAHNGESSVGADYAIDDIRAYVVPATALAQQEGFACDDIPVNISIQTSFETLIEKLGKPEGYGFSDDKINLYYAVVDKEKFDKSHSMGDAIIGKVQFSNNFTANPAYTDADGNRIHDIEKNKTYYFLDESDNRMIAFEIASPEGKLKIGKDYYVVFKVTDPSDDSSAGNPLPEGFTPETFFDLGETCSYYCTLTIEPSLKVKIDGIIQPEFNDISVCENQSPVIQLNVWSVDEKPVEVMKNAWFDWFDGSINEFENYRFKNYPASLEVTDDDNSDSESLTLKKALEVFRFRYYDAETVTGIKPESTMGDDNEILSQWMLDIIDVASSPDASGRQRLLLHQGSYVVPSVELSENENGSKTTVVAIPIVDLYPTGDYEKICAAPTEVGLRVANHSPILRHGLTDISYPENLTDVPLRIGLDQFRENDKQTSSLIFSKKKLDMPVRLAASSDGKERNFQLVSEKILLNGTIESRKGCILLAQTNDPEYHDLGTLDEENNETGYLLWVGEIKQLKASSAKKDFSNITDRDYFIADFDTNFKFKEGYFYKMRFSFEEESNEADDADTYNPCNGHELFSIKIVPQFAVWTGDRNLSWDNDDNWRRVSAADISAETDRLPLLIHNLSDGMYNGERVNSNKRSYAPLDFTKVIIDQPVLPDDDSSGTEITGDNPWLYSPRSPRVKINDSYSSALRHDWTPDPARDVEAGEDDYLSKIGRPTSLIQYDMTAYVPQSEVDAKLHCRPWSENNCSDIHFLPGSTIMNQHLLSYDRAWVDIELDHSRWYILSTPLKSVYAGDFYLPSDNARQETELFREIKYDEAINNRFSPAVYQRGWDKSVAKVYEFGKETARNAAIRTFWSNVYNDVSENYGEGNAFSIKTDISGLDNDVDKVLFRLPKADDSFLYYAADHSQEDNKSGHQTSVNRDNAYRLNNTHGQLYCATANPGKYFLVGNPFMTHFDIRKFLKENEETLQQKYWVITEKGMIAAAMTDSGDFVASPYPEDDNCDDPSSLAPMQGFFVEAKEEQTSLSLNYDESMMRKYDNSGSTLLTTTRANLTPSSLKISAFNNDSPSSAALIISDPENQNLSVEAFDSSESGIPATIFTAKNGKAFAINFCNDLEGVEIGVIADPEIKTKLLFEATGETKELFLVDRNDNTYTPLSEISELDVTGSISGRFYLSAGMTDFKLSDELKYTVEGNCITIINSTPTEALKTAVFDMLGSLISEASAVGENLSFILDPGIYILKISNENEEKTLKIHIR